MHRDRNNNSPGDYCVKNDRRLTVGRHNNEMLRDFRSAAIIKADALLVIPSGVESLLSGGEDLSIRTHLKREVVF